MTMIVSFLVSLVIQKIKVINSNVAFIKIIYVKTTVSLPALRFPAMTIIV